MLLTIPPFVGFSHSEGLLRAEFLSNLSLPIQQLKQCLAIRRCFISICRITITVSIIPPHPHAHTHARTDSQALTRMRVIVAQCDEDGAGALASVK